MKTDDEIRAALQQTPLPEPIGGHHAARERVMGRVRHRYPVPEPKTSRRSLLKPLAASAALAAVAFTVLISWPEPAAEADTLPDDVQMRQLYDQHEAHFAAHLRGETQDAVR
jgi:hypothetical protein